MSPRALVSVLVALSLAACGDGSTGLGSELDVTLALERSTIAEGDSARADVDVVGRDLVDLTIFWGDESPDSVETFDGFGAETLSRRLAHEYVRGGTYRIQALARERSGDTARAVATLQVQAPSASPEDLPTRGTGSGGS